jgi:methyltransferase
VGTEVFAGLATIVFGLMAVEAVRAARNERFQHDHGGVEPAGDVYSIMQLAYPAAFLAMLGEALVRGMPGSGVFSAGLAVFVCGKALKWWAILTLGRRWTFRVITVPGAPLVRTGPYRFLRHPNYAGVIGELVGVALMTNALVAGPIVTAAFGALILKRIAVEDKALRAPAVSERTAARESSGGV